MYRQIVGSPKLVRTYACLPENKGQNTLQQHSSSCAWLQFGHICTLVISWMSFISFFFTLVLGGSYIINFNLNLSNICKSRQRWVLNYWYGQIFGSSRLVRVQWSPEHKCQNTPCTLWCQLEDTVLLIGTLLLFDPVVFPKYEAWLLIGSILIFEALLGAPLIRQFSTYCIYLCRCVF